MAHRAAGDESAAPEEASMRDGSIETPRIGTNRTGFSSTARVRPEADATPRNPIFPSAGGTMRIERKKALWALVVCGFFSLAAPARADVVTDWNELAFRLALIGGAPAQNAGRVAASIHPRG